MKLLLTNIVLSYPYKLRERAEPKTTRKGDSPTPHWCTDTSHT